MAVYMRVLLKSGLFNAKATEESVKSTLLQAGNQYFGETRFSLLKNHILKRIKIPYLIQSDDTVIYDITTGRLVSDDSNHEVHVKSDVLIVRKWYLFNWVDVIICSGRSVPIYHGNGITFKLIGRTYDEPSLIAWEHGICVNQFWNVYDLDHLVYNLCKIIAPMYKSMHNPKRKPYEAAITFAGAVYHDIVSLQDLHRPIIYDLDNGEIVMNLETPVDIKLPIKRDTNYVVVYQDEVADPYTSIPTKVDLISVLKGEMISTLMFEWITETTPEDGSHLNDIWIAFKE